MSFSAQALLKKYDHCNDGLFLSFGFFYDSEVTLCASATFLARDNTSGQEKWDKIFLEMRDVAEFHADWKGNQAHSISTGVKLLELDGLWCLDVDGVYDKNQEPVSLNEVRRIGECYFFGREVKASILTDK